MSEPAVTIIGAGIGGLTAALALQRWDIPVQLYEQASELGEIGAGINVSPNGLKVLYALNLCDEIEKIRFQPKAISLRHYETGNIFFENPFNEEFVDTFDAPFYAFHRADLHRMLLDAVTKNDPTCITVGKRLVGLDENHDDVVLKFEDGSKIAVPIVVGADGVHSTVRTLRHRELKAEFTGHVAYRGMVKVTDVERNLIEPKMNLWAGPKANPKIPKPGPSKSKDFVAQVGAFSKYQNAQRIKNLLVQGGFNAEIVEVPSAGRRLHAVRVVRFHSFEEAEKEGERVKMKFGLEYRVLNRPK